MLPIPHRVNITLGVGNMVKAEKVRRFYISRSKMVLLTCKKKKTEKKKQNENPTPEEINVVHQKILEEVEGVFNLYKDALGMGQKTMHFV